MSGDYKLSSVCRRSRRTSSSKGDFRSGQHKHVGFQSLNPVWVLARGIISCDSCWPTITQTCLASFIQFYVKLQWC